MTQGSEKRKGDRKTGIETERKRHTETEIEGQIHGGRDIQR